MPVIFGPKDIAFFQQKNKEIYKNYFMEVEVYELVTEPFDKVYGEDSNKRYKEPYKISAYIPSLPGWDEKLTRF